MKTRRKAFSFATMMISAQRRHAAWLAAAQAKTQATGRGSKHKGHEAPARAHVLGVGRAEMLQALGFVAQRCDQESDACAAG